MSFVGFPSVCLHPPTRGTTSRGAAGAARAAAPDIFSHHWAMEAPEIDAALAKLEDSNYSVRRAAVEALG